MSVNANAPYIAAKILGPFCVISGAALFAQTGRMMGVIDSMIMSDGLMMFGAFLSLLTGLAILALASSWGNFTEIIISLMGWFALLRGIVTIFVPGLVHSAAGFAVANPASLTIAGGVFALLGLWLCFQGFFTTHVPENEQLVDSLR